MLVHAPSLIGRTEELATLRAALERTRQRHGGVVFLLGEAGIGKSRLATQTITAAQDDGMLVLRGRASEFGGAWPFRPIAEALLALDRADETLPVGLLPYQRALGALVPAWRDASWSAESVSLLVLAEAVLRLAAHAGRDGGVMVVLEDLHRADPETLTIVEYLADNLGDQPTLVVGTIRTEACAAVDLARDAARRRAATVLELEALTDLEVGQLAAQCLQVSGDKIPKSVLDRLRLDCAGNPFFVEELLNDMLTSGALAARDGDLQLVGKLPGRVPRTVVHSVTRRADRTGEQGRLVLRAAAILGRRFPLAVVQQVTALEDSQLMTHIDAGIAAQLIVPDEQSPDWFAFRHALTVEALIGGLGPHARAELAGQAADAIEACYPGLPGHWCQLAAEFRLASHDDAAAGRLYLQAGRYAMANGATDSAVDLLERAGALLADPARSGDGLDAVTYAESLELLLLALLEVGHIDRALALADNLATHAGLLGPKRLAVLHAEIGWVAVISRRWAEAEAQITAARALLGTAADDDVAAQIDIVTANLIMSRPLTDDPPPAEAIRWVAAAAKRVSSPGRACRAWQLLGVIVRNVDQSNAYFHRILTVAEEHRLPLWRVRALAYLAHNEAVRCGEIDHFVQARTGLLKAGAIAFAHGNEARTALLAVLRGDWALAQMSLDRCWAPAVRLRLDETVRYAALARAAMAAHQGRRTQMEQALVDFRTRDGETSQMQPTVLGMCMAICALLEEEQQAAYEALASCEQALARLSMYTFTGHPGLYLLLQAIRGELDLAGCQARLTSASIEKTRWNLQFALFAHAVLLGREGRRPDADAAAVAALQAASVFPMARHLGVRLAAEAAIADGWGEPIAWLRAAEEYFRTADVPAIASACRALLRRAGARVNNHRSGHERVPKVLRRSGITGREFDVLELLVHRWGNKEIAERLHISPRTVEKHVASLITKTEQPDRGALIRSFGEPHAFAR
jgi:DNA-binding CsgD family transcriptional regulator/tetratricopeptide (TPR) repeat protein